MCMHSLTSVCVYTLAYLHDNGLLCMCLSLGEGVGARVGVLTRKKERHQKKREKTKRERERNILRKQCEAKKSSEDSEITTESRQSLSG